MRGLETVSVTRRNGRGLDSSLKKSMDIPVRISLPYGQSLNVYLRVISTATNIVVSHFTAKKKHHSKPHASQQTKIGRTLGSLVSNDLENLLQDGLVTTLRVIIGPRFPNQSKEIPQ